LPNNTLSFEYSSVASLLYYGANSVAYTQRTEHEQVCWLSLLSGQNVRWPRRMLLLVSNGEYADGTGGTDARYVFLGVTV